MEDGILISDTEISGMSKSIERRLTFYSWWPI